MLPFAAYGQPVPLVQDSYVFASLGSAGNYGSAPTLQVNGALPSYGLVQFDLSTLPAGITSANIAKATLVLFVRAVGAGGTINVATANSTSWTESGVTINNSPNGATSIGSLTVTTGTGPGSAGTYVYLDATVAVQGWL